MAAPKAKAAPNRHLSPNRTLLPAPRNTLPLTPPPPPPPSFYSIFPATVYVFALITLLPAAIITSVSAYRVKLHLRHGIPPPTTGCSSCGYTAALVLSSLGAITTLAIMGAAFNLVGPALTAVINTASPGAAAAGGAFIPIVVGMPGPTLAILAMLCSVLGAALLLCTLCCTSLTALPGFGTRCRIVCDEAGQPQPAAVTQFNPAGSAHASSVAWGVAVQQQGKPPSPPTQFIVEQGQPPQPPPSPPVPQFIVQGREHQLV